MCGWKSNLALVDLLSVTLRVGRLHCALIQQVFAVYGEFNIILILCFIFYHAFLGALHFI